MNSGHLYCPKIFIHRLFHLTKPEDSHNYRCVFFFIYKDLFGIYLSFSMRLETPLVPRVPTFGDTNQNY